MKRALLVFAFALPAYAGTCVPDLVTYYPSPVYTWMHPIWYNTECHVVPGTPYPSEQCTTVSIDGFRVYARIDGQPFELIGTRPCWWYDPEDGILIYQCSLYAALQKYQDRELEIVDFAITAYRGTQESQAVSFSICLPPFLALP